MKRNKRKEKWVDFKITKIKLNPEQVVLSCCDTSDKSPSGTWQCYWPTCGPYINGPALS